MKIEKQNEGNHVEVFLYRIPRKNHDQMARIAGDLESFLRKHGSLGSRFHQLEPIEAFQGFTKIADTLQAGQDEEVWLELDHYLDLAQRNSAMVSIATDPAGRPLFGRLREVVTQGFSIPMGDFRRLGI